MLNIKSYCHGERGAVAPTTLACQGVSLAVFVPWHLARCPEPPPATPKALPPTDAPSMLCLASQTAHPLQTSHFQLAFVVLFSLCIPYY